MKTKRTPVNRLTWLGLLLTSGALLATPTTLFGVRMQAAKQAVQANAEDSNRSEPRPERPAPPTPSTPPPSRPSTPPPSRPNTPPSRNSNDTRSSAPTRTAPSDSRPRTPVRPAPQGTNTRGDHKDNASPSRTINNTPSENPSDLNRRTREYGPTSDRRFGDERRKSGDSNADKRASEIRERERRDQERKDRDRRDKERKDRERRDKERGDHDRRDRGGDYNAGRPTDSGNHYGASGRPRPPTRPSISPSHNAHGRRYSNAWVGALYAPDFGYHRYSPHHPRERRRSNSFYSWTGYNHSSRLFMGIHFLDPFYSEWVYCGGRYYYWRGVSYPAYRARYVWDYSYTPESYSQASMTPTTSIPVSFPPSIPPLYAPPPAHEVIPSGAPPSALQSYVLEPFYAALSTRLAQNNLYSDQELSLYKYREQRDAELAELQREISLAQGCAPAQSKQLLEAFADIQQSRLQALENLAENLRFDLLHRYPGDALVGSGNWAERLSYYMSLENPESDAASKLHLDFLILRAAAFYQDGLSRWQRELLREAAEDLQVQAYQTRGGMDSAAIDQQALFFSPSGARIPVNENVPDFIRQKLSNYTDLKAQLKQELVDLLNDLSEVNEERRVADLKAFSYDQASALEQLEALADDIREDLVSYPEAFSPAPLSVRIPSHLAQRIEALCANRSSLALDFNQQYRLFTQDAAPAQVRVLNLHINDPDPEEPPPLTLGASPGLALNDRAELRTRIQRFNDSNKNRHQLLRAEQETIIAELDSFLRTVPGLAPLATGESLFEEYFQNVRRREVEGRYTLYKQAALLPGLCIEQRRLLFGAAISALGLPLPSLE